MQFFVFFLAAFLIVPQASIENKPEWLAENNRRTQSEYKFYIEGRKIMMNESIKTGMKIGATICGLVFFVFAIMPGFSLTHAVTPIVIVELILAGLSYAISLG